MRSRGVVSPVTGFVEFSTGGSSPSARRRTFAPGSVQRTRALAWVELDARRIVVVSGLSADELSRSGAEGTVRGMPLGVGGDVNCVPFDAGGDVDTVFGTGVGSEPHKRHGAAGVMFLPCPPSRGLLLAWRQDSISVKLVLVLTICCSEYLSFCESGATASCHSSLRRRRGEKTRGAGAPALMKWVMEGRSVSINDVTKSSGRSATLTCPSLLRHPF
jgi:hypothetical protein